MPAEVKKASPARPRREQVEWRREELLQAALRVFAQRGVEAASLKEVAAEAGVAPGLIHHYFGKKDGLVLAVIERFGFLHQLEDVLAASSDRTAREVLTDVATGFGSLLASGTALMTIFFTGLANPQVRNGLDEHMGAGQAALAAFLAQRVKAGELREHDTRATAQLFLSAIAIGQLTGTPSKPAVLVDIMMAGISNPRRRR